MYIANVYSFVVGGPVGLKKQHRDEAGVEIMCNSKIQQIQISRLQVLHEACYDIQILDQPRQLGG